MEIEQSICSCSPEEPILLCTSDLLMNLLHSNGVRAWARLIIPQSLGYHKGPHNGNPLSLFSLILNTPFVKRNPGLVLDLFIFGALAGGRSWAMDYIILCCSGNCSTLISEIKLWLASHWTNKYNYKLCYSISAQQILGTFGKPSPAVQIP